MDQCTCGARAVPDALFCHRCGRPLRELAATSEPPLPAELVAPQLDSSAAHGEVTAPTEINFRNRTAVRIGLLVAAGEIVLGNVAALFPTIDMQMAAFLAISAGSGAVAVVLYRLRTGQKMTVKSGAQLGWITGVFSFVITIVITTLTIATVGLERIAEAYRASAARTNTSVEDLDRFLGNPPAVALALVVCLVTFFAAYTIGASVGGAFGAKLLDRRGT